MITPARVLRRILSFSASVVALAAVLAVATSCSRLPTLKQQLDRSPDGRADSGVGFSPPTVADLVEAIQCELALQGDSTVEQFVQQEYVVTVNLTADILANDGVNPSLSFISPRVGTQNLTKVLGAQWSGMQHKQFTQTFVLDLSQPFLIVGNERAATVKDFCARRKLAGQLGVKEIVDAGFRYAAPNSTYFIAPPTAAKCWDPSKPDLSRPTFGAFIDFTVVLGINGGPTWTLTRFKGPAGSGAPGLLSYVNTEKNVVQLSFAPGKPSGSPEKNCRAKAGTDPKREELLAKVQAGSSQIRATSEAIANVKSTVARHGGTESRTEKILLDNLHSRLGKISDEHDADLSELRASLAQTPGTAETSNEEDKFDRKQAAIRDARDAATNQLLQTLTNQFH